VILITLDIQLADAFVPPRDRSIFSCPSLGNPVLALVSQYTDRHCSPGNCRDHRSARGSWGWF